MLRALLIATAALALPGLAQAANPSTAPAAGQADGSYRIALVADPHVSANPKDAAFIRHFERVAREVNDQKVDVVFIAGDLTTDGLGKAAGEFKRLAGLFKSPVHLVAGNHDVGNKPLPDKPSRLSDRRIEEYERQFGPSFYAVQLTPDIRLVALNTSLLGSGLTEEAPQWAFLERELAPATQPADGGGGRKGMTILLEHFPPFVNEEGEADGYFNIDPASRKRLLTLIRGSNVRAVLSGHLHRPVVHRLDGVLFLTAPPVSFGLPKGKQPEGWTLVTVHADGSIDFAHHYLPTEPPTTQSHASPDPTPAAAR